MRQVIHKVVRYYAKLPQVPLLDKPSQIIEQLTHKYRIQTFAAALIGHSIYYVCRTTLNVVKTPIVNSNLLNDQQLGIIGSCMLFAYAAGKFINSFIADRSNIKRFMATGLLISLLANLIVGFLGFATSNWSLSSYLFFVFFAMLWAVNGWAQSMGTAPPIVSLSRWFPSEKRGTYYGFFSAGHNIGEFLSFIFIGTIVGYVGWKEGFISAGLLGLVGVVVVVKYLHDSPESEGLPFVGSRPKKSISEAQLSTLKNKNVWILASASAFMYISRYAINGWGVRFLEIEKHYSIQDATWTVGLNAVSGIVGAVSSGWISDRFFHGRRNVPALFFGMLNSVALAMFLFCGDSMIMNAISMLLFGLSIGVLICFLGGLMATDIAPKNASGAAVGMIGLMSYIAAGCQDIITGTLIESNKSIGTDGIASYNFLPVSAFWIGASILSFVLAALVWNVKAEE